MTSTKFSLRKTTTYLSVFFHPLSLSLLASIVIILLLPYHFPKYKAEIADVQRVNKNGMTIWDDLENDGSSDCIYTYDNTIGTAALCIRRYPLKKPHEWDFRGNFSFDHRDYLVTGDYDGNGSREVYTFTISHDTIYLNGVDDPRSSKSFIDHRLITTVGQVDGKSDSHIISGEMDDLDNDGFKELVFAITSGFSIRPRAVFAYDIRRDTLLRSPEVGSHIMKMTQGDVTGDGKNEIMLTVYAPGNITDKEISMDDSSCWLVVLDRNLRFLFDPVKFFGHTGSLHTFDAKSGSGIPFIQVVWAPPAGNKKNIQVYWFNTLGKKVKYKALETIDSLSVDQHVFEDRAREESVLIMPSLSGGYRSMDSTLNPVFHPSELHLTSHPVYLDIDLDGRKEMIFTNSLLNELEIVRTDLQNPAYVKMQLAGPVYTKYSLKITAGKPPQLIVSSGDLWYTLNYAHDPLYYLKWLIYLGIYLSVLMFTLVVQKIQRNQIMKRIATEHKITKLQLTIVRNQMDPHFTMNAINAVVDAINREEKEQARDNLLHFSKMYRSLVLSADKIKRTLREEIEFTENYLALEQFRFRDRFRYVIEVHPDVDQHTEVPKMVIQSPVENAVKHGLSNRDGSGEVRINIRKEDKNLVIEVMDNGVGRQAAEKAEKSGTGKGMEMMSQFFDLYHRITGVRVQSVVTDLEDETGNSAGTNVVIRIQTF